MGFTISKNQGSGRTVITVTPEEKNATDKDIVQILTVEAVDGSTKGVKLIHKKGEGNASNRPFPNHKIPDSDYSAYTQPTGGGSAHENRPPYYVLAYVMKIR